MVRRYFLVVHTPGILVYRVGKWHPILSWIKKVISPLVLSHALSLRSGMPYANSLGLFMTGNVRIGYGITVPMCSLGFATDLVWNGPPCDSQ